MKNKFITFEGIDGAGKSTVMSLVADQIYNKGWGEIYLTEEPNKNIDAVQLIKEIILNCEINPKTELLLFEAARSENVEKILEKELNEGNVVLCSRFVHSTLAYQKVAGCKKNEINWLNNFSTNGLLPGLVFIFDLSPKTALKRIPKQDYDKFEIQGIRYYNKLRKEYLNIVKKNTEVFKVIDASKSIDEVVSEVLSILEEYMS